MNIAVFGAGALGGVYGVRLALHAGVDVAFVVRPGRVDRTEPIAIERVKNGRREALETPSRVAAVPDNADVILLAVGTEDLDAIAGPIGASEAPIIVLTPTLPKGWERLRRTFGDRVYAAMPNVAAYARESDGVIRYWRLPASTKIDEPAASSRGAVAVRELAGALTRAGLRGRLELGVHERNPATTVSFIAIGMGLAVAGSAEALTRDPSLMELVSRAEREGVRLAHRIGAPEPWTSLAPSLAAPWALRAWLTALRRLSPEGLLYAEEHFGRKLKAQHRSMIREMIELAADKGLPHTALVELGRRLDA